MAWNQIVWRIPSLLLVMVAGLQLASATHFRFGTISWCSTKVNSYTNVAIPNTVTFKMTLVFKRNYDWGRWYKEMWSRDGGLNWYTYYNSTGVYNTIKPVNVAGSYQKFENMTEDYTGDITGVPWQLQFPTAIGPLGVPLRPGQLQCTDPLLYAGNASSALPCSPWSETVGWFFGDGTHQTTNITIDEVVFENTAIGNYLRGHTEFIHTYTSPTNPSGEPWLAYFTGGNRLSSLNNNADGRYRLETTVDLTVINCSPIATGLPVLPVPYVGRSKLSTYGQMSTFQIAAYDPDVRKNLEGDKLSFRLGDRSEFGYLLQHSADTRAVQWTREQWQAAVQRLIQIAVASNRPVPTTFDFTNRSATWDDNVDFAHPPEDLVIDRSLGIVTWETGINYWQDDVDNYYNGTRAPSPPLERKKPGFYNLVIMVSSNAQNPRYPTREIKVPLDFLMYLYPPIYTCALGCRNGTTAANAITTFRTNDGSYGDPGVKEPNNTWIFSASTNHRQLAPGTGRCTLCGGGETRPATYNPKQYCIPTGITTTSGSECDSSDGKCPGVRVNAAGLYLNNTDLCQPALGNAKGPGPAVTIIPAQNACKINTPPYWVFRSMTKNPKDTPDREKGDIPLNRAYQTFIRGTNISFNLVARDDDDCVELRIRTVGMYFTDHASMDISKPTRDVLPGGIVGKQIRSEFTWIVDDSGIDDRPEVLTVCFYAFDNYLLSPFLCVRIQLVPPSPPPFPPPSPPPPSPPPPPPPACNPLECQVPWTNCMQVHDKDKLDCLDGILCPKGNYRCGTTDSFVCFDPSKYMCTNYTLRPYTYKGNSYDYSSSSSVNDWTTVRNCTAVCVNQPRCEAWDNCGAYYDKYQAHCIDGMLCPRGKWRCGEECYWPGQQACTVDNVTRERVLTSDLRFDGFGIGPCVGDYPIPAWHGCKDRCYLGCKQMVLYDNCPSPYIGNELACIDGFLCPAHMCRFDYKDQPGCKIDLPGNFRVPTDALKCLGPCSYGKKMPVNIPHRYTDPVTDTRADLRSASA